MARDSTLKMGNGSQSVSVQFGPSLHASYVKYLVGSTLARTGRLAMHGVISRSKHRTWPNFAANESKLKETPPRGITAPR